MLLGAAKQRQLTHFCQAQIDGNLKQHPNGFCLSKTTMEFSTRKHSISTKLYLLRDVTIYKDSFIKRHYFPRRNDILLQFVLEPSAITI